MSGMTDLLHDPGLWNGMIIIGILALLADCAWRSWTLEGRVDDPARLWPRPAPARLAYAFGPMPVPAAIGPTLGDGYTRIMAAISLDTAEQANDGRGATEKWSPIAEQVTAGRSLEDWWSERLQEYDAALKRIDAAPRLPDGTGAFVILGNNVAEELDLFVSGSMRLKAYRSMRLEHTGEFTKRQHMQLEALVNA